MEFRIARATPDTAIYENEHGQQVVITPAATKPVRASGSLMSYQVEAVVEGHQKGLQVIQSR